ncbi:pilus assembly protein TadG-related protein [Roseateles sp.]|uniref:pilus assembly protein TadG-related protein n=1 Tax=Roseateles sp. TaxID=1971397 RepID=UPI0026007697|nr:pilus assembly protein TadG-related protein [Roseateles sp.]MBV8036204.1 pilus assembly protein TadG [Roseateles sp.]
MSARPPPRPARPVRRPRHQSRERSLGAVALVVALLLAVMVGFLGLAVDGGRLYLAKTELQNAADACALAASYELTGAPSIPAAAFPRAEAAGRTVAKQNRVGFQGSAIVDANITVGFGSSLAAGSLWSAAGAAAASSKYARCTLTRGGFAPYFMRVMGFGASSVTAIATATLTPAQSNCAVPLGVCMGTGTSATSSPPFGLTPGAWVGGRFKDGGGNWNWINFNPPAGGEAVLAGLLTGNGMCSLNITTPVGQPGNMGNAAAKAWNSRFGLYQTGSTNVTNAPPDFTGYAYTTTNWPSGKNAVGDFITRRASHTPYGSSVAAGNSLTGLSLSNAYNPTTTVAQHTQYGADRRLVSAPIIDCSALTGGTHTTTVQGWACVLMLQPIDSPNNPMNVEFIGMSTAAGSPCASSGVAGDTTSAGPMVPALVQ